MITIDTSETRRALEIRIYIGTGICKITFVTCILWSVALQGKSQFSRNLFHLFRDSFLLDFFYCPAKVVAAVNFSSVIYFLH